MSIFATMAMCIPTLCLYTLEGQASTLLDVDVLIVLGIPTLIGATVGVFVNMLVYSGWLSLLLGIFLLVSSFSLVRQARQLIKKDGGEQVHTTSSAQMSLRANTSTISIGVTTNNLKNYRESKLSGFMLVYVVHLLCILLASLRSCCYCYCLL